MLVFFYWCVILRFVERVGVDHHFAVFEAVNVHVVNIIHNNKPDKECEQCNNSLFKL